MLLTYTPEGADPRVWTFTPDKLMSSEAEAIEKVTHLTYLEFGSALIDGSVTARRALLWVFLKRTEPTLRYAQVDFPTGSLEIEYEQHELRDLRDATEASTEISDEERVAALNLLDGLIVDDEVEAPKANASSAVSPD